LNKIEELDVRNVKVEDSSEIVIKCEPEVDELLGCEDVTDNDDDIESESEHSEYLETKKVKITQFSVACPYCEKIQKSGKKLEKHILELHSTADPKYACPVAQCGKLFLTKSRLQGHGDVHDESKKAFCTICAALLCSQSNLRKHMRR
jgi:hypothetical protein